MWGAENAAEMEEMLDTKVYAVKFNYHSGSPGYVGDYFILQGDAWVKHLSSFATRPAKSSSLTTVLYERKRSRPFIRQHGW